MKILGISGFERAIPFKRARWPQLDEREYRISQGHDSAAALVVDGAVVAAVAEERINRRKHTGAFPRGAIACCLAEAGVTIDQIDELAHGFDYAPYAAIYALDPGSHDLYRDVYSREALLALVARDFPDFPAERVHHVSHHLAHAASAYYTSGWDECLVVVIDGMGEAHSVSVYCARDGRLDLIFQVAAQDSIGILYSLVTLHLGFDFNADEYKIMGLAPYGDPERFRRFFEEGVELLSDGGICIPLLRMNRTPEERERYLATRAYLTQRLLPSRDPAQEIAPAHRDVAAALQACLDRTMLHLCSHFAAATGQRRLALTGGVALNCTANGKLLCSGVFDDVYVQPAAGDDGSALGAALYRAALAGEVRSERLPVPFLGPGHRQAAIDAALGAYGDRIQVTRFDTLAEPCAEAARLIAGGRVVAWYRGRLELGPRALGHRRSSFSAPESSFCFSRTPGSAADRVVPFLTSPGRSRASVLVQPFAQHQEEVQPLAVIAHAVTVLPRHGTNPSGVEPSGIAQARTLRQLIGPSAGRPTPEPHLQWRGKAVLGSLEQLGRDEPLQQRLEQRLAAVAVQQPTIR